VFGKKHFFTFLGIIIDTAIRPNYSDSQFFMGRYEKWGCEMILVLP